MDANSPDIVERIGALFHRHGHGAAAGGPCSALAHALQCAHLADRALADLPLVAAALLHDVGHLLPATGTPWDRHELRAQQLLARHFGAPVAEPVRLHVAARRWLARVDARYVEGLQPAALRSLVARGGPMNDLEARSFEEQPHAMQAVRLRRWDDAAHAPGKRTPPLGYFLQLLDELRRPAIEPVSHAAERLAA